jgi:large subunit ribosomal protein L5
MSEKSGAAKSPKPEGKPQKTEAKPQKSEDAPQKSEEKSLPVEVRPTPRMQVRYRDEIVPAMMKEFNYRNIMEVPRIEKIAVNIGLGEAIQNSKALEAAAGDLAIVTGQKAVITKAKKSIAVYKLREGMSIGVKTTLRGARMWDFLDRLINVVLPRQRDFQGVSADAFDGRGNYSLGLREQLVFPEISYEKVDKIRGLEVTIVTTAKSDEEARRLLALMSMPFKR